MQYKKIGNLIIFENGTIYREFKNKCKIFIAKPNVRGYSTIKVNGKYYYTHVLIMEVFKGKSGLEVDHIDGDKLNNSLDNLEYVTHKENMIRMIKRVGNRGILKTSKKVSWNGKIYPSSRQLSRELNLDEMACSRSIRNRTKLKGHYAKYI